MAILPLNMAAQHPDSKPKWEQTEAPVSDSNRMVEPGAAITVQDMNIYIELEQPTNVKLFTILGQPVSQMQLPAGTSRFRVPARGIYILKIGASTRRITI